MTGWFVANMIGTSLVMLLVLALRRPVGAAFGAGPAYALWALPALRLIMPPQPAVGPELPLLDIMVSIGSAVSAAGPERGLDWALPASAAWLAGIVVFVIWQWLAYRRFLTALSLDSRSIGTHGGLPLIESRAVEGPLALGLLDRRIVVPADFETRYTPAEQQLALDHEAIHHRRGDIWWNHAALLVLALNWFNPVAWLAFRAFRADQELACDAAVAATIPPEARCDYARALVKSASPTGLITASPLNHADQLKRRLKMMKHHRKSPLRLLGGAAVIATLAGLSLATGAPGIAHPHPERDSERRTERIVIMKHDREAGEGERVRTFRMRRGEGGHALMLRDCDGGEATNIEEGDDNRRTRIVLCNRGDASPAQRAEQLERARERLAQDSELSAEMRQRVTATLDREIARLRGR